jgi:hypothetical protein
MVEREGGQEIMAGDYLRWMVVKKAAEDYHALLSSGAPEGREDLAHGPGCGKAADIRLQEPRRGDRREPSAGSYAPPGLKVLCRLLFPGLAPWARLSRPSGANRTTRGDVGKIVIPDKVYFYSLKKRHI